LLLSLREFGRIPQHTIQRFGFEDPILGNYDTRYVFERLGYNVRMTDIAASLGIEQLKKLDSLNAKRIRVVNAYTEALRKYQPYFQFSTVRPGTFHSSYGYAFVIKRGAPFTRLEFARFLESRDIETRSFFAGCIPDQPGFRKETKKIIGKLPISRWLRDNALFIGCHPALTPRHIAIVTNAFHDFFKPSRFAQ